MTRIDNQEEFLLELINQLLGESRISKQEISKLNSSSSPLERFDDSFTDRELNRLEEVIIPDQNDDFLQKEDLANSSIDFDELKKEMKKELKKELKEEKAKLNNSKAGKEKKAGNYFRDELKKYSVDYIPVQITVYSGIKIKGLIRKIKQDFVSVMDKNNNFIKIPLNKIVAVKKIKNLKKEEAKDSNIEVNSSYSKRTKKDSLPAPEKLFKEKKVELEKVNKSQKKNR